jgi:tetratricopeptide (TPR) repeat protein
MFRRSLLAVIPAALAILAVGPSPASAQEACIPPKITEALASCSGARVAAPVKRAPVTPPPVAPPASKAAAKGAGAPDPKVSAKEIRRALASQPAIPLLLTEIQGLETLLTNTSAGSPDRPGLIRRLADSYVEMESVSFRKKTESRMAADEAKRKDPGKVAGLLAEATKAEKIEAAARTAAIKHYAQLRARHPTWCQSASANPPAGCLDETLYDLAYEHEQAGDLAEARKVYLDLIQTAPASPYVPHAYLAFGELFFQEAQGDPSKWALAEQSYKEVVRFPAPGNKVLAYAHYKLAYVAWNKGDIAQALGEMKRTIEIGAQFPTLPNVGPLATSARRDIVPLYALRGDPKKAHDFFHPLSGDGAGQSAHTFQMMDDLGQGYLDVGHYQEGIELYQDLMKRDRGPKSCTYQAHVTEAVLAQKTGDKAAAKAELDRQLQLERRFRGEGHGDAATLACANATASLAAETAMIWHLEAVGSGNVRGTMSKETMGYAADLYEKLVDQFTAAQFAKFEFPRLVKEDWPTLLKIKQERAELLYADKDWARCGKAFDAVVDEEPKGPLAAESAYASALCYQNAAHLDRSARPAAVSGSIARRELDAGEKAMVRSFDRFLCVVKPEPGNKEIYDNYVEVDYARAYTYFKAHQWPEAAAALRRVAMAHPGKEASLYAAQLYLEALNVMASHGTTSCLDDMARDLPELSQKHCGSDKGKDAVEGCENLDRVQRDVAWSVLGAKAKSLDAAPAGPARDKAFEEVANGYLGIWTRHGKDACEAKQPGCDRMDAVLDNAATAFQAAHLLAKTISVRKLLLDSRYNLDRTPVAREAVHKIGQHYLAIAVYDEAAAWYERFAHDTPGEAGAAQALQDAIVLRLGLGEVSVALHDAELFQKTYREKHPALAAQVAFAIGAHDAEHGDYAEARKRLSAAMTEIDRSAAVDVQIQAHAVLGRALWKTGGETGAAAEFARVRSLYRDPAAVVAKLKTAEGDEAQAERRLGKVLSAVGEALNFSAAQKQKATDAIRFPEYKGSGRREDVLAHVRGKVAEWMKRKRPALEEAEKEYKQVVDLRPAPPPQWVTAAGAKVGQMWGKFVAEFRAAPIPKEWKQNGPSPYGDLTWQEIRGAYYEAIDLASEPDRKRAKVAYQTCLE